MSVLLVNGLAEEGGHGDGHVVTNRPSACGVVTREGSSRREMRESMQAVREASCGLILLARRNHKARRVQPGEVFFAATHSAFSS